MNIEKHDDYYLYFSPYIGQASNPQGRIVITFYNLQKYVQINVSDNATPIQTLAYLRVSYYQSSDPNNALYTKDGGGDIEYTNKHCGNQNAYC